MKGPIRSLSIDKNVDIGQNTRLHSITMFFLTFNANLKERNILQYPHT